MTTRDDTTSKPPSAYDAPETTGVRMAPPDTERAAIIERSDRNGVPGIDVKVLPLDLVDLDLVPRDLARRHQMLPLLVRADALFLAMADPGNRQGVTEVEFVTGKRVFVYGADPDALRDLIDRAYDLRARGSTEYAPERASVAPPPPLATRPSSPGFAFRPQESAAAPDRRARQATLAPPSRTSLSSVPPSINPPIARSTTSAPPRMRATSPAPSLRSALVVDADAASRATLREALSSIGFEVREATTAHDGLSAMRTAAPALVVVDPALPDRHGFDLLRAMRDDPELAKVPVLLTSAEHRGWRIARDLGDAYAVRGIIEKPATPADIVVRASEALTPPESLGDEVLPSIAERAMQQSNEAWQRGDVDGAVAALEAAVAAATDSYRLRYHLGLALGRKGNVFRAIHELERSVALRDRFYPSLRNLAILYERAGFRHKALEAWERACASAPDEITRDQIKERVLALL